MIDPLWFELLSEVLVNMSAAAFIAAVIGLIRWKQSNPIQQLFVPLNVGVGLGILILAFVFRKLIA